MAIVPIEIIGQLKTKNYQPLSNFTLYVVENGFNIHRHQNNNVTTVNGLAAFKTLLESYITNNNNHIDGVITSSSVTVDTNQGHINVNILGEGNNDCDHFAGAFFTEETWDERNNHTIALRFLGEEITPELCADCQDVSIAYCDGNVEFTIPVEDGTYVVAVEDHNNENFYTQTIVAVDGVLEWDMTNTAYLFTPFSYYTITLVDSNDNPVSWTTGTIEYNCLRVSFKYSTDTNIYT